MVKLSLSLFFGSEFNVVISIALLHCSESMESTAQKSTSQKAVSSNMKNTSMKSNMKKTSMKAIQPGYTPG